MEKANRFGWCKSRERILPKHHIMEPFDPEEEVRYVLYEDKVGVLRDYIDAMVDKTQVTWFSVSRFHSLFTTVGCYYEGDPVDPENRANTFVKTEEYWDTPLDPKKRPCRISGWCKARFRPRENAFICLDNGNGSYTIHVFYPYGYYDGPYSYEYTDGEFEKSYQTQDKTMFSPKEVDTGMESVELSPVSYGYCRAMKTFSPPPYVVLPFDKTWDRYRFIRYQAGALRKVAVFLREGKRVCWFTEEDFNVSFSPLGDEEYDNEVEKLPVSSLIEAPIDRERGPYYSYGAFKYPDSVNGYTFCRELLPDGKTRIVIFYSDGPGYGDEEFLPRPWVVSEYSLEYERDQK